MERARETPAAPAGSLCGRAVGDFQILSRLGSGGMGEVYLARQISLGRPVALKVLRADLAADPVSRERFRLEAEAAARVVHANIVQIYAIGEQDGVRYLAMEYVEGWNLRDFLERKGPPALPLALSIMRQVAAALQRAAEAGIVHRDLKPENILLTRKGEAKVADFGLSRCLSDARARHLTETGTALGTPLYMSPEQVRGQPVDPRSDLYSFGVTCYYLLAGRPPFTGQTAYEVALHHVQTAPRPLSEVHPGLPAALCAVVERLMAKRPEDRYQSAREVFRDLTRVREALGAGTIAGFTLSRPRKPGLIRELHDGFRSARPWVRWSAAASVLLALAGGAALGWRQEQTRPPVAVHVADPQPPVARPTPAPLTQEEKLLAQVKETVAPGSNRQRLMLGMDARLDLGLLYLEQGRLNDADRFFGGMTFGIDTPPIYRALGRLGHAVVLAFQDRAADSNRILTEFFAEHKSPTRPNREWMKAILVNRKPAFHQKIAQAIDRNARNGQAPTPELEALRKPQPYVPHPPSGSTAGASNSPDRKR